MTAEPIVVFHHIPKTAGRSLVAALRDVYAQEETYVANGADIKSSDYITHEIKHMHPEERARIRFVFGHQVWYGIHELFERRCVYVTFLRHPVARVVSRFFEARRMPGDAEHAFAMLCKNVDVFANTVNVGNHMVVYFARRHVVGHNESDRCLVSRDTLRIAVDTLAHYAFVGIQEDFANEVARLNRVLPRPIRIGGSRRVARRGEREEMSTMAIDGVVRLGALNWADAALYAWALMRRREPGPSIHAAAQVVDRPNRAWLPLEGTARLLKRALWRRARGAGTP